MDPLWICAACKSGDHLACDWWRGCEDAIRRGPNGVGLVLCESLTIRLPKPREGA